MRYILTESEKKTFIDKWFEKKSTPEIKKIGIYKQIIQDRIIDLVRSYCQHHMVIHGDDKHVEQLCTELLESMYVIEHEYDIKLSEIFEGNVKADVKSSVQATIDKLLTANKEYKNEHETI